MFVNKKEFRNIDVKEVFDNGNNFIKITDGRHEIFRVKGEYKVIDYKSIKPLPDPLRNNKIPKYIKRKLA